MGPAFPPLLLLLPPVVLLLSLPYLLRCFQQRRPAGHHEGRWEQTHAYSQNVRVHTGVSFNAAVVINEYGVSRDRQSANQTEERQQSSLRTEHEDDSLPYGYQDRGDLSMPSLRPRAQIGFESHHDTVNDCRELARL
ncbi:uncharacterized protein LOC116645908 [Phoca vitulina]|uniref:uncharacterized protein LOC116645908 n=1 Tax=Phoca vitulina TaxID=9720 RepID=UPI00139626C9|nr:uncharacterized protein LOC116645908 [Phoca vitulina]